MKKIVIATRNPKKLKEIKRLFKKSRMETVSLNNFSSPPCVIENGKSFRANAVKKAVIISRFVKGLTLADDSGLEVEVLNNKPGVKSSRYAGPGKIDRNNNLKLLEALKNKSGRERLARFRCVVAVANSGKLLKTVQGSCRGKIGFEMKGKSGFGYDSVFIPQGYKKSFSQLGSGIKDSLSHRAKALRKAAGFIQRYL